MNRPRTVGLRLVHVGVGANSPERCLAVSGLNEVAQRVLLGLRQNGRCGGDRTKNAENETLHSFLQVNKEHRDTKGTGAIEDDSGTDNEIKRRISMSVPRLLRSPLCLCVFAVPNVQICMILFSSGVVKQWS